MIKGLKDKKIIDLKKYLDANLGHLETLSTDLVLGDIIRKIAELLDDKRIT